MGRRKPVVISLFSGAMGLDLGMEEAGLRADVAVEINPAFCETIRLNRPGLAVLEADVEQLGAEDLLRPVDRRRRSEVDLMVGGPPCQSFSPGGKRAGLTDPRGNLILTYLRLIAEVQPRYFVLENVSNLSTAALRHRPIDSRPGKHWNLSAYSNQQGKLFELSDDRADALSSDEMSGSALRYLLSGPLTDLGYNVSFSVLNSQHYGAAQKRLRFVLIGSRLGPAPRMIDATHGEPPLAPFRTVKDEIGDLSNDPGMGSEYTEEYKEFFSMVPPGGHWRSLPDDVARRAMGERSYAAGGGKTGFFRRLAWDQPSPTVTGKPNRKGSAMCHPEHVRPLSVRECARLQGFPDDWAFVGSMDKQYLQVGNAVPVKLGVAIGATMIGAINGQARAETRSTDEMFDAAQREVRQAARNTRSGGGNRA